MLCKILASKVQTSLYLECTLTLCTMMLVIMICSFCCFCTFVNMGTCNYIYVQPFTAILWLAFWPFSPIIYVFINFLNCFTFSKSFHSFDNLYIFSEQESRSAVTTIISTPSSSSSSNFKTEGMIAATMSLDMRAYLYYISP